MGRSLSTILYGWLKELKIPASKSYVRQQLNSHPNHPSLLSITDALDEMGIDNAAMQIEKEQLPEMPVPFLAHLNGNGGEFVMVKKRDNLDKQFPDFFKRWGGVAIAAEKPKDWQHKLNTEWLKKDKNLGQSMALTLATLSLFIILSAFISFSWLQLGLLFIAIAGVFVSWMIVSKDLGIENKIANEVCGASADCNMVIHFKAAKLPFGVGWSDAGIIYFSCLLLISAITSFTETGTGIYPVLFLLATCSLPFTFISIYYQWRVIKKWCRLCLITVALLWTQFILLVPEGKTIIENRFTGIILNTILLTAFLLFTTTAAWLWLKPLLKKNKELETENFAAQRFKNNADVFMTLLERQRKVDVTPFEEDLQLGNPDAPLQILVACNPYCGPCAKAHKILHELVEKNDIGLTIRFTVKTDNKEDKKMQTVEYILQLCLGKTNEFKRKILLDWYEVMNMEKFKTQYPLKEARDVNAQLEDLEKWSVGSNIQFTPTIFVYGFELPKQYKTEGIKTIIRSIAMNNLTINECNYATV